MHLINYITNHKTQFMTSITPTCFGTGVPSSGNLRTPVIFRILPKDGTLVPKHVGVIVIKNCVLWFVIYCILLRAFVDQCTEYSKMRGKSNKIRQCLSATLFVHCITSRKAVLFLHTVITWVFVIHVSTGSALHEISGLDKLASQILIYLGFV